MNLNNFKNHINKTILDRGYDYYKEGNIVETYKQGDNEYIFEVEGSEDYEVVVIIDNKGEIQYSECNCPYDFGPICKHQVAAYFELSDILKSEGNSTSEKKSAAKQPGIKEVLSNLSKEELIEIIMDITKKDKTLKNSLTVKYSKGDSTQEIKKCKNLIDSIVKKYAGRGGFIEYSEVYDFVSEMEDLFDKVRDTEDTLLSLDIAFLLLNEAIEAFQYADDSEGEIGSLVAETIELIEETAIDRENLDFNVREKIFNKLLAQSNSRGKHDYKGYEIEMLRLCAEFANIKEFRDKLREEIEDLVNKNSDDEYMKYSNESLLQILLYMIEKYGTKEEAEQFIKDNIMFSSFRELLINRCLKDRNYHRVIDLALEGEKQDEQYAGLVLNWRKFRYVAYKTLSIKEEQEKLAKILLLDGNFEYYSELKELAPGDKSEFYNSLKQELKKDESWSGRETFLKLILEENDLEELLEFVRKNPRSIEEYDELLVDKFRDEVIEIYKKYIKARAASSTERKHYKGVCGILKRYNKIAGKKNQEIIINELKALYMRRPAFIDELSKIQ